jgi:hypothetical protein
VVRSTDHSLSIRIQFTIHKHNLYVQFCNTEHSMRGVISMGTKIFNGLPSELRNVKNFNVF